MASIRESTAQGWQLGPKGIYQAYVAFSIAFGGSQLNNNLAFFAPWRRIHDIFLEMPVRSSSLGLSLADSQFS